MPGYIAKANELKSKGIDEIVCVSVNDPFVMSAWGKDQGAEGKVKLALNTCNFVSVLSRYPYSCKIIHPTNSNIYQKYVIKCTDKLAAHSLSRIK